MGTTEPHAQRESSPLAGEGREGGRRESGAPGFGFDFADEIAGRERDEAAAEQEARADGWKIILTIAAFIALITATLLWHLATAGPEPAAKRGDRLTAAPLPPAYCTAPAAAEAG